MSKRNRESLPFGTPKDEFGRKYPEPSPHKISKQTIELANGAFQRAYPKEYGKLIKPLIPTDVIVVNTDSSREYIGKNSADSIHPQTATLYKDRTSTGEGNQRFFSTIDAYVLYPHPQRPIVVHDSLFVPFPEPNALMQMYQEVMLPVTLSTMIIHEQFHKSQRRQRFNPNAVPELTRLAFANHRNNGIPEDEIEKLLALTKDAPSQLIIEGSLIFLLVQDSDGKMKQVAYAGYDLTEAIIDTYIKEPVEVVKRHVQGNYHPHMYEYFASIMRLIERDNARKAQNNNYLQTVGGYLKQLGLETPHDVIDAFINGRIPQLHAEKLPNTPYLT